MKKIKLRSTELTKVCENSQPPKTTTVNYELFPSSLFPWTLTHTLSRFLMYSSFLLVLTHTRYGELRSDSHKILFCFILL